MDTLSRKERDKQLRRSDILKAAEHIFATHGYHKATIKDIAEKAQYATGTVYLYFKDKQSLYKALLEEKLQGLIEKLKTTIRDDHDPLNQLKTFILICMDHFRENQNFFRITLLEENKNLIEDCKKPSPVEPQFLDIVIPLIQKAQKEKLISSKYDAGLLSYLFSTSIKTVIIYYLYNDSDIVKNTEVLVSLINDFFLNGVSNKKN